MAEWFYLECLLADRARDLTHHASRAALFRRGQDPEGRPVLSTTLEGWTWQRTAQVAGLIGLALALTLGLPAGILGAAWVVGAVVGLLGG